MSYLKLSAMLRTDIRSGLGSVVLNAIQDHLYHKALGYFDPAAQWQTTEILELSELAHRLRDFAETMPATSPVKLETMRLAKIVWNDFADVYKIAMKRVDSTAAAA